MKLLVWLSGGALAVLICASLNGCVPSGQSQLEEEKEPHFLDGKSCVNSMDYKGAIESFEKALEVNPHSASAHFELALLFNDKEQDPAAAIYHYEQFLKLRPNYVNGDAIQQRITRCKQDLAKTVLPLPVTPAMQREFEELAEQNKRLQDEVEKWRAYYKSQSQTNQPVAGPVATRTPQASPAAQPAQAGAVQQKPATAPENRQPVRPATERTHIVQSGESLYSIARKYGIRLDALEAANSGLEPKRLRAGQTLNIPAP
jgi:LysM repeat protein